MIAAGVALVLAVGALLAAAEVPSDAALAVVVAIVLVVATKRRWRRARGLLLGLASGSTPEKLVAISG